jgi:hypothetical protein
LDGPRRKKRRERLARRYKTGFAEREGVGGHTAWKGEEKLEGWGIRMEEEREKDIDDHSARLVGGTKADNLESGERPPTGAQGNDEDEEAMMNS